MAFADSEIPHGPRIKPKVVSMKSIVSCHLGQTLLLFYVLPRHW